jgi:hypothetical protein
MPITHPYNQAQDSRWWAGEVKNVTALGALNRADFIDTDTSEGVCFSLSIWWIIKNARGEDYWAWMPGPGPQVSAIKDLFRQQLTPGSDKFWIAKTTIEAETTLRTPRAEGFMQEGMTLKGEGYYYISMEGQFAGANKASAHGIAVQILDKPPYRYFDPNIGEGEADTPDTMLTELKDLVINYAIKNRTIKSCRYAPPSG